MNEPVTTGDAFTAPSENEIELNQFPLQVGPVVPLKRGNGTRKTDRVGAQSYTELIDPQAVEIDLIQRREGASSKTARCGHESVHMTTVRLKS